MTQKAMFTVKRRQKPMLAAIVRFDERTGRQGRILASEPLADGFSIDDLVEAAKRLVPLVQGYEVILPTGVDIGS